MRATTAHGVLGGLERHADALARGLADRGHDVTVASTAAAAGSGASAGVTTIFIPGTSWRRYQRRWWTRSYAALQAHHGTRPYDAVLSQSAGALGYLRAARRGLGVPTVVVLHGSSWGELVTAARSATSPRGVYRLARLAWRLPPLVTRWRRAAPYVERWVAVAPAVAAEAGREMGFPPDRVVVVPNGVDTRLFAPSRDSRVDLRRRLGIAAHAPVLLLATRLEREKGVQVALEAAARLRADHPSLRVVIAGGGRHGTALRRRCRRLGLEDAVTFTGLVAHDRLAGLCAAADVFVMPSLCHEAFPITIVEALSAGLPVVASSVPGAVAALQDTGAGSLVTPGDARALERAVRTLLDDEDLRREMSARARAIALQRFDVGVMVDRVEAVLDAVVRAGSSTTDRPA